MRFDAVFRAAATGTRLTFTDAAYASRIGWREIVVTARDGAAVLDSSAPAVSRSGELNAYPKSLLRSPLDVRTASVTYRPGTVEALRAGDRRRCRSRAREQRVRVADPARRPLARRRPALAADRRILGCGARIDAGSRESARRGLPRGNEREAAPCVPARGDRDGDPHRGRLRPRARDPVALPVHRPRPALPVAHPRLRAPRRRGRRLGAAAAAPHRRLGRSPT